jgi:hypothetical protein
MSWGKRKQSSPETGKSKQVLLGWTVRSRRFCHGTSEEQTRVILRGILKDSQR